MTDDDLAADIAARAGALLLDIRNAGLHADNALGDEGDARANTLILEALAAARSADAVLSEEHKCDGARLTASRVWIVDPLDGTREYREGRDDWAVHIALAIDGVATAGAVALPAQNRIFSTGSPAPLVPVNTPLRIVESRTRPAPEIARVAERLGAIRVAMGSAGAKAMAVVRGDADIYLHTGGQYEWDSCAPVAVAQAYGLHVSRIDGSPLRYNHANPYLPDLLITRPELAADILAIVAAR